MWDQGSEGWDLRITSVGLRIRNHAKGSESAVCLGIRDQAVTFLWDQEQTIVEHLE